MRIAHVGAWGRNFGDFALQAGEMAVFSADAGEPLEFLQIHSQKTRFHPDLIDHINATCDLMVVGGGGLIFHRPEDSSRSGWQFDITLEDLERIKVPLAVYAIGYNAFHFDQLKLLPIAMQHLKAVQDKAFLFSVRNQGTKRALIRGGLDAERIEVIPDPGMYVPPVPFTLPKAKNGSLKIGINWAGDRPHFRFAEPWEQTRAQLVDAMCGAFEAVAEKHPDLQVYFLPHLEERIDSDVWPMFQERLGERVINLEDDASYIYPPSLTQVGFLADAYRQMDLAIGMRGHATIVPFGMNTPVLGLGSHDKVGFFLEEVGMLDNWLSNQTDAAAGGAEAIASKILQVLAERPDQKARMAGQFEICRSTTRGFHQRMFSGI
ncbi:polysaccharide pyruvyl transferase family protein [Roseibium suaedae]|uniref:Polysaccharide pyruvyl transferase family protein WcaK n=1 Tax=Roseibium suaedae TaxID=735517 RepID=A0A1M7D4T7_9HYPH|nr:polysaccharide pyruvyl transferase family protein [Roseibium suaedae]SHL74506.1 Polysaccharide pyruvyl transferase family protein WcaK [Roseibium suaedae]